MVTFETNEKSRRYTHTYAYTTERLKKKKQRDINCCSKNHCTERWRSKRELNKNFFFTIIGAVSPFCQIKIQIKQHIHHSPSLPTPNLIGLGCQWVFRNRMHSVATIKPSCHFQHSTTTASHTHAHRDTDTNCMRLQITQWQSWLFDFRLLLLLLWL